MDKTVHLKDGTEVQIRPMTKVEQIVVRMMRPQVAARHTFRRLGFREEFVLPEHFKDRSGASQDLILMRCDLEAMWSELESFFAASDWQRTR